MAQLTYTSLDEINQVGTVLPSTRAGVTIAGTVPIDSRHPPRWLQARQSQIDQVPQTPAASTRLPVAGQQRKV